MREFTFLVNSNDEAARLEGIAFSMGASRINQEGWTEEYGGSGILMFIESAMPKREWNVIVSGFNSVQLLKSRKVA